MQADLLEVKRGLSERLCSRNGSSCLNAQVDLSLRGVGDAVSTKAHVGVLVWPLCISNMPKKVAAHRHHDCGDVPC